MTNREYFNIAADVWDDIKRRDFESIGKIFEIISINPKSSVLDVGCGTGILFPFISQYVGETGVIVGLDISEKMIEKAKQKIKTNNIELVCEDFLTYTPNRNFDYILAYSTVPHFRDIRGFHVKQRA